jgi:putative ABC transport system permease protein
LHQDVAVCCVPNAGRLLPTYVKAMWLRTPAGLAVRITATTHYPFELAVEFAIAPEPRPRQAARRPGRTVGMTLGDWLSLIIENLSRRTARVALTAIGVVIGTAAVVVLVSLGIGLQRSATETLGGVGDLTLINVNPIYTDGPGGGGGQPGEPGVKQRLTDDLLAEIAGYAGVTAVVPREFIHGTSVLKHGRLEAWSGIYGVGTADLTVLDLEPQVGTAALSKGRVVLGSQVPLQFNNPQWRPGQPPPVPPTAEELVGRQLQLTLTRYTQDGQTQRKTYTVHVAGVLSETRTDADWSIYMGIAEVTAMNEWLDGRRIRREVVGYPNALVKVGQIDQVLAVADQIAARELIAETPQSGVEAVSGFFLILQVIFGGVGAIALLVAAIGIANTMAMAILERTREIGLMKAVGATNRQVVSLFLGEAAGIGFIGGLGGVALGWSAGELLNVLSLAYFAGQAVVRPGLPPPSMAVYTPPWLLAFALTFATLVGLLSGLYPALSAATLVPVKALKHD